MNWDCRTDPLDGELGLRWGHKVVQGGEPESGEFCFIGLASDEGVRRNQGRLGAADGPEAIRRSLANLPFLPELRLRDFGDVTLDGDDLESAQASYASAAAWAIQNGAIPIGLGGGHEIAFASYAGLRQAKPEDKIGLLYFDAHFDLREDSWRTSGTSIRDILTSDSNVQAYAVGISSASNTLRLFQTAKELGVGFLLDEETQSQDWKNLSVWAEQCDSLYVSFDLDVLPAHEAPGVSAPAGLGVPYLALRPILKAIMETGKVKILDIAELNPSYDLDSRTARLAARIIWDSVTWLN